MCEEVIRRLKEAYSRYFDEEDDPWEIHREARFLRERGLRGGEAFFVPEDWLYEEVLKFLEPDDVVFDVGAGDLRFDLMMAGKVRRVYAVEVNPDILGKALLTIKYDLPRNVIPVCANALDVPLPKDVTAVTILMIHRTWEIPEEWVKQAKIIYTTKNGVKVIPKGGR